jgi:hypothetical protein
MKYLRTLIPITAMVFSPLPLASEEPIPQRTHSGATAEGGQPTEENTVSGGGHSPTEAAEAEDGECE